MWKRGKWIVVRDRESKRVMGKFTTWDEVWDFQRLYLHPIEIQIVTKL